MESRLAATAIVIGNESIDNWSTGIYLYGSNNIARGNITRGNNQSYPFLKGHLAGIAVGAGFGGTAQYNILSQNTSLDDQNIPTQYYALRIDGDNYSNWRSGVAVKAGTTLVYGLNVYTAESSGGDRRVGSALHKWQVRRWWCIWTFNNTFNEDTREPVGNLFVSNSLSRSVSPISFFDGTHSERNLYLGIDSLAVQSHN